MSAVLLAAVITGLGLELTPWREEFFTEWARWEGTGAKHNPLATTQPGGEDPANPYWNTFGEEGQYHVRNYADEESGVAATVTTIRNGYYPHVLLTLQQQAVTNAEIVAAQIDKWGTTGFAVRLRAGWSPAGSTESPPAEPLATVDGGWLLAIERRLDRIEADDRSVVKDAWLGPELTKIRDRLTVVEARDPLVLARLVTLARAFSLVAEAYGALAVIGEKAGEPPAAP